MPGFAEHGPPSDEPLREVRYVHRGPESDSLGSVSDRSTRMTEGVTSSLGGYEQRLRGHLHRGEMVVLWRPGNRESYPL